MSDDKVPDDFKAEYRADKKRQGWFSVVLGILFIAWTIFDIATNFWEEYWYVNIFFFLLGLIILIYGILDIRKYSKKSE